MDLLLSDPPSIPTVNGALTESVLHVSENT